MSPLFRQSKRYSMVLKYLVHRTLDGLQPEALKERTIGVEVFGRSPAYDTNADPTVRVVASEIRKRLILYYLEPGHASEVRISLPAGSYVPEFTAQPQAAVPARAPVQSRLRWRLPWAATAALIAVLLAAPGMHLLLHKSALDGFWGPVLHNSPTVLVCVGEATSVKAASAVQDGPAAAAIPAATSSLKVESSNSGQLVTTRPRIPEWDVVALTHITDFLQSRNIAHSMHIASITSLADLRQGPAILIGSFSNYWTMRLDGDLRYQFRTSKKDGMLWIEDVENPAGHGWAVSISRPRPEVTEDYGLITRVVDASTGRIVVSVAGVTGFGTAAGSEFLTSRAGWDAVAKQAPKGWQDKNIQVVIATKVINGNFGPPSVIATHFW